ncbi:MAG: hypothetical protein SVW51_13415 [Pseudomonadota bacterium]|nr:hypothetical protein [Pseudomonadota bacterium]
MFLLCIQEDGLALNDEQAMLSRKLLENSVFQLPLLSEKMSFIANAHMLKIPLHRNVTA